MKFRRSSRRPKGVKGTAHALARVLAKVGLVPVLLLLAPLGAQAGSTPSWRGIYWGESATDLLRHFGRDAVRLPRPIDFGDSIAEVVLPDAQIAGYRVVAFFQMNKRTGGLKRIQTEWPHGSANPAAFRALRAALETAYGAPDRSCAIQPTPTNGFQAGAEALWRRRGDAIRAIFRDTTIAALEGCLGAMTAPCGLTGRLLLRISQAGSAGARCPSG